MDWLKLLAGPVWLPALATGLEREGKFTIYIKTRLGSINGKTMIDIKIGEKMVGSMEGGTSVAFARKKSMTEAKCLIYISGY